MHLRKFALLFEGCLVSLHKTADDRAAPAQRGDGHPPVYQQLHLFYDVFPKDCSNSFGHQINDGSHGIEREEEQHDCFQRRKPADPRVIGRRRLNYNV